MSFTVGKVPKNAEVNVETIRYYERRKLLPKPKRSASGYREYTPDTVKTIRFIKHAQEIGFSLREVHELLALKVSTNSPCADVKKKAEVKITQIKKKIKNLKRMQKALEHLKASCETSSGIECPLLEALENF